MAGIKGGRRDKESLRGRDLEMKTGAEMGEVEKGSKVAGLGTGGTGAKL